MYKHIFASFALLCLIFVIRVNAEKPLPCPTRCAATSCIALDECNLPNQEVRISPEDICRCCPFCVTILSKGERCDDPPFVNGFKAAQECNKKKKLICKDGVCQKCAL